jgi:hypothetical protein
MRITGQVQYQEIEGGFWGIVGDDGANFVPVEGLSASFKTNGLHIEAEVEIVHMIGTSMWGQYIKVLSITEIHHRNNA